jgi:squalene-hopene/tetraprenyl-beta-curcumene cyclase
MLATLLLSWCAAPAVAALPQGPGVKDLLDPQLASIRLTQKPDGSYGQGLRDTANVVIALSLGPRAYRMEDGPFIRKALLYLDEAGLAAESEPKQDALVAFALASSDATAFSETIQQLARRAGSIQGGLEAPFSWNERSAAEHLIAIPPDASISQRAEACAKAVIAYQAEKMAGAGDKPVAVNEAFERGVDFLQSQIGESGMWEAFGQPEPGISALAARAMLGSSRAEMRAKAEPILDQLLALQKEDGSIHGGRVAVYTTSVAIGALAMRGNEADLAAIVKAANYLRVTQSDEGEGYSEDDKFYGGIGYGNDLRPDLSNLQYALQALKESGAKSDDPAFQRAIKFLERSQNLSEVNRKSYYNGEDDNKKVVSGDDGGAVYYPGNSMAGYVELEDGTLVARSYGSMTYALLKCYLFAGLDTSDPRVAAALDWIERNWTVEVNPGFNSLRDPRAAAQGLYYYYLSLAQCLGETGKKFVTTPDGKKHDWRAELQRKLASEQREDGSWINEAAPRWWEGNPVLCTAYALGALHASLPPQQ